MTTRVYNRGKPNKKFASVKIEQSNIERLKFVNLLTSITNQSELNDITITDSKSKSLVKRDGGSNIIMGVRAGTFYQGESGIAIGTRAGTNTQGDYSISIGSNSGNLSQASSSISIGKLAGVSNQGATSIAIGSNAGYNIQNESCISIGTNAGKIKQDARSISIGSNAGTESQGASSISIGLNAGSICQAPNSIAIGIKAGYDTQNPNSIAIGSNVGALTLGEKSIVIGNNIVCIQDNTLAINTSDEVLTAGTNGLFIGGALIERNTGGDFRTLVFNKDTKQVVYDVNPFAINKAILCVKGILQTDVAADQTIDITYDVGTASIIYEIDSRTTSGGNRQFLRLLQEDPTNSALIELKNENDGSSNFTVTISAINTTTKVITLSFDALYVSDSATPYVSVMQYVDA